MKRILLAACIVAFAGGCAFAQATARQESLTMDTRKSENLTVNHKAYSAIQFNGTVTDSVANAAINITGKTGSIGFKTSRSSTAFFAQIGITVTDGANGKWTGTIPGSQWATNVLVKTRFYGDLLLSDFGNPLPSIDLWLYPSANTGTETNYVAPTSAGFETNLNLVSPLTRISFDSGFDFVYPEAPTNRLRISVTPVNLTLQEVANNGDTATNTLTLGGIIIPSDTIADQTNPPVGLLGFTGGGDVWQSFTAGKTGILTNFHWISKGAAASDFKIYEEEGTAGTELWSGSFQGQGNDVWQTITCNVPINAEAVYTFRTLNCDRRSTSGDKYARGRAKSSATEDWVFTTTVYTARQEINAGGGVLGVDTITVGRVRGNLIPDTATRTLGTEADPWFGLYLIGATIWMSGPGGGDATNAIMSFNGTNIIAYYTIADTNGVGYASTNWVIAQGYLTDETLWDAASNTVVYTNDTIYTDTVAKASTALQPADIGAIVQGYSPGTVTNIIGGSNVTVQALGGNVIIDASGGGADVTNTVTVAMTNQVAFPNGLSIGGDVLTGTTNLIGDVYVHRGDPASVDFSTGDFTRDNAWHDLDLSSIVPAGAKVVFFTGFHTDPSASKKWQMRRNGMTNIRAIFQSFTTVGNIPAWANSSVACDTNRVIEYIFDSSVTAAGLTITGWMLPADQE